MNHTNYETCEPFRAWNRIEPRPRKKEFEQVLSAEIHDPLWFLTRQWQFGEFQGEDSGSPIFAKVHLKTSKITEFSDKNGVKKEYLETTPLECTIEKQYLHFDVRTRALAGQKFLDILKFYGENYNNENPATLFSYSNYVSFFMEFCPFTIPVIKNDNEHEKLEKAKILSNKKLRRFLNSIIYRVPDGILLHSRTHVVTEINDLPVEVIQYADNSHIDLILESFRDFNQWVSENLKPIFQQDSGCWKNNQLEYGCGCSIPGFKEKKIELIANAHCQGNLDWWSFDINSEKSEKISNSEIENSNIKLQTFTVIPSEARFSGMPNARWWEFEDGSVDLGNISSETTDLAKLLVAEYAMVYSNDWFLIPYTIEIGTLSEIEGISIKNVFGENFIIDNAQKRDIDSWVGWNMFTLSSTPTNENPNAESGTNLFMPPALSVMHESEPIESIKFFRDEIANIVWGIENRIKDLLGFGIDGDILYKLYLDYINELFNITSDEENIPEQAELNFKLSSSKVPGNWIPFIPVHNLGDNRSIRLQRASMPRILNEFISAIRPKTEILRYNIRNDITYQSDFTTILDDADKQIAPYFIIEEEVPKAGVVVNSYYKRARWYNGTICNWYGYKKIAGYGQISSGLKFDKANKKGS